eukprot:4469546-Amphidinium_carterae.1
MVVALWLQLSLFTRALGMPGLELPAVQPFTWPNAQWGRMGVDDGERRQPAIAGADADHMRISQEPQIVPTTIGYAFGSGEPGEGISILS